MKNPYVKYGTLLMDLMTMLNPSEEIDLLKLGTK
jgi:hypothetical protein